MIYALSGCVFVCLRAALEKDDPTVKIRIFELLSAICVYSPEGYMRVIDVLEHYKVRMTSSDIYSSSLASSSVSTTKYAAILL